MPVAFLVPPLTLGCLCCHHHTPFTSRLREGGSLKSLSFLPVTNPGYEVPTPTLAIWSSVPAWQNRAPLRACEWLREPSCSPVGTQQGGALEEASRPASALA